MGKEGKSTTQNTYPAWLQRMLQPYIGGAVGQANEFRQQGENVLQGRGFNEAAPANPSAQFDRAVAARQAARRGGGNG